MIIGYLRGVSGYKVLGNLLFILFGIVIGLSYQSFFSFKDEHIVKEFLIQDNKTSNSWIEFIAINNNSPFDFLDFTHSPAFAYLYQENLTPTISHFCQDKVCIKGEGKNEYPIYLKSYMKGFCGTKSPGVFKRDDDVFVSNQVRDHCRQKCNIDGCCVCGQFYITPEQVKNYYYATGMYYYLNPASKDALCGNTTVTRRLPEDVEFAAILNRKCSSVTKVELSEGVYHRNAQKKGWSFQIYKSENHR